MARIEDLLGDEQTNALFQLSILANIFNCWDFFLDKEQISNDEIMKELHMQDHKYLSEILNNQKLILKELNDIKERL